VSSEAGFWIGAGVVAIMLLAAANQDSGKQIEKNTEHAAKKADPASPEQLEAERITKLFEGDHYAESISAGSKLLFDLIRRKSGVSDKDTMALIDCVFSPKKPILRFTRHDTHDHLNTHDGYYFLLKGVSAAFRNPASHASIQMTEGEARIQLQMIGYLYELVDHHAARVPSEYVGAVNG